MSIDWVDLMITNRCNLNCSYCFHKKNDSDMFPETLDKIVKFMAGKVSVNTVFNLFGGEPFLRSDFCIHCIEVLRRNFSECLFCASTNGVIYNEDLVDRMMSDNPANTIQISHDGVCQSLTRGESVEVDRNVGRYLHNYRERISFRLTFTKDTVYQLLDSVKYLYGLGARFITHQADFKSPWDEKSIIAYKENIDNLYEFIAEHDDLKMKYCGSAPHGTDQTSSICGAGRVMVAIDCDGKVYPCHRFVSNSKFVIGDIDTGAFNRGRFSNLINYKCNKCSAVSSCHQCIAANFEMNGSMLEPIGSLCDMMLYEHNKYKKHVFILSEEDAELCNRCSLLLESISITNKEKADLFYEKSVS